MINIASKYNAVEVEEKLYRFWEEEGFFQAHPSDSGTKPFCIVIPPPNITGSLHMGHALNNTIQDCLTRWKRMQGANALWIPGVDHAGIATQNVVEKELMKEGVQREKLGREEFVGRVWQWKEQYGGEIVKQLRLLGSSCDWKRLRFTMDERYSDAVLEEFVHLHREGLIYRGSRIINWCPRCRTALSDIEVEHEEVDGKFYYIKYPLKLKNSNSPYYITVATTRPETMLGDTAVAVHPEDGRYKSLVGKSVTLPLVGREIPVICDERVEQSFGTGAVKVTPAHDPEDFEIGLTHNLPEVRVIGEDGRMTEDAGKYSGQDRYECRENVLKDLKNGGYLLKIENHTHSVGHCYRCGTVIEPLISLQWFVRMKELSEPAIKVVEEGKIKFYPDRWSGVYLDWMRNIKDWCISRQIWWGHRIPVWYCEDCKFENVGKCAPAKCGKCGSDKLRQDEDVLDTWFSSALWPLSALGWPEDTQDLRYFYPTSVLVTGYEIICFWVARMIMTGLKFKGDIPFSDVYIHGIVRDAKGRKMSKSLGNVIDPREIIKIYGTDALRMTLITALGGQDIYLGEEKLEGMRHFSNKLWNAGRFILMSVEKGISKIFGTTVVAKIALPIAQDNPCESSAGNYICNDAEFTERLRGKLTLDDRWILAELQNLIKKVNESLCNYRFSEAGQALYRFSWHEFCDWYLELAKPRLADSGEKETVSLVLLFVWERLLRLLHPFMPFITEELWQLLHHELAATRQSESGLHRESIMVSPWPEVSEELVDEDVIQLARRKYAVIEKGRELRAEAGIPPRKKMNFIIEPIDRVEEEILNEGLSGVKILLGANDLSINSTAEVSEKYLSGISTFGTPVHMIVDELNLESEKERIGRELKKVEAGIQQSKNKLSNPKFLEKAPVDIVEKEKLKKEEFQERREKLLTQIDFLKIT